MKKDSLLDIILSKDDQIDNDDYLRGKKFFTREFSGSITKRLKRMQSVWIVKLSRNISYFLSHISTKVYGTALLSFGLMSILLYFLRFSCDDSIVTPIVGIVVSCLSIPFLLADKPLPIVLQDFAPTDYLFFEFFCMKRHTVL